ncbi:MAG TPA: metallophosphoesterase family protein [Anaerolineales bacterium]|nr:metallophosphoesterase family protein [Anaerolineales bacterium]
MRIALLSDIHANWTALSAVLAHARRRRVDEYWHLGDLVGYCAFPNDVVRWCRKNCTLGVIGNYDLRVLSIAESAKKQVKDFAKSPKHTALEWADAQLSSKNRKYLLKLPKEVRVIIEGKSILATHGNLFSLSEAIKPDTPPEKLLPQIEKANAQIILTGHSHIPFKRKFEQALFINPGSVGRPQDGDARASYAILHITEKSVRITLYRVEYDVAQAVQAIQEQGLPPSFGEMLLQARTLGWVSNPVKMGGAKE